MKTYRNSPANRLIACFIAIVFTLNVAMPPGQASAQLAPAAVPGSFLSLPQPGTMVTVSPVFAPPVIKGLKIFPDNPLRFDFIIDVGDSGLEVGTGPASPAGGRDLSLRKESEKLIKYFLASLTIPEDDLWVNLSPYEKERIIPQGFGRTEMGRDLLAQDYILKQLTSSLMYPEGELGQEFWDRIYKKAYEEYGTTEIPVNTFNKVWIVPEKADVYVNGDTVLVVDSRLKVMLEEDYMAMQHDSVGVQNFEPLQNNNFQTDIIREIILPEIENEVNNGKNFAPLRQIYHSMILATWFKRNLKQSVGTGRDLSLQDVYIDQNKTAGVDVGKVGATGQSPLQQIYQQYIEAFKKGVYNFIKEDYDSYTRQTIPRKYFSGGMYFAKRGVSSAIREVDHLTNTQLVEMASGDRLQQVSSAIKPEGGEGGDTGIVTRIREDKHLSKFLTSEIEKTLTEDLALRPIFLISLSENDNQVGPLEDIDYEIVGKIGGTQVLDAFTGFLIGDFEKARLEAAKGKKILIGVADKFSPFQLHETTVRDTGFAHGRQVFFPLSDGSWLGVKGIGQLLEENKPPYYLFVNNSNNEDTRQMGLAGIKEAENAMRARSLLKGSKGRFVQFLGFRRLYAISVGDGRLKNIRDIELKDPNTNFTTDFEPVIIFNRVLTPHRYVKMHQILGLDPDLKALASNLLSIKDERNILIPKGVKDAIIELTKQIGENQAVKQNHELYKRTINVQDFTFASEEADMEEFMTFGEKLQHKDMDHYPDVKELFRETRLDVISLIVILNTVLTPVNRYLDNLKGIKDYTLNGMDLLRLFYVEYFKNLNNEYLKACLQMDFKGISRALLLATFHSKAEFYKRMHSYDEAGEHEKNTSRTLWYILTSAQGWLKEEAERRGLFDESDGLLTASSPLENTDFAMFSKDISAANDFGIGSSPAHDKKSASRPTSSPAGGEGEVAENVIYHLSDEILEVDGERRESYDSGTLNVIFDMENYVRRVNRLWQGQPFDMKFIERIKRAGKAGMIPSLINFGYTKNKYRFFDVDKVWDDSMNDFGDPVASIDRALKREESEYIIDLIRLSLKSHLYIEDFKPKNVMIGKTKKDPVTKAYIVDFDHLKDAQDKSWGNEDLIDYYLEKYMPSRWFRWDLDGRILAFLEGEKAVFSPTHDKEPAPRQTSSPAGEEGRTEDRRLEGDELRSFILAKNKWVETFSLLIMRLSLDLDRLIDLSNKNRILNNEKLSIIDGMEILAKEIVGLVEGLRVNTVLNPLRTTLRKGVESPDFSVPNKINNIIAILYRVKQNNEVPDEELAALTSQVDLLVNLNNLLGRLTEAIIAKEQEWDDIEIEYLKLEESTRLSSSPTHSQKSKADTSRPTPSPAGGEGNNEETESNLVNFVPGREDGPPRWLSADQYVALIQPHLKKAVNILDELSPLYKEYVDNFGEGDTAAILPGKAKPINDFVGLLRSILEEIRGYTPFWGFPLKYRKSVEGFLRGLSNEFNLEKVILLSVNGLTREFAGSIGITEKEYWNIDKSQEHLRWEKEIVKLEEAQIGSRLLVHEKIYAIYFKRKNNKEINEDELETIRKKFYSFFEKKNSVGYEMYVDSIHSRETSVMGLFRSGVIHDVFGGGILNFLDNARGPEYLQQILNRINLNRLLGKVYIEIGEQRYDAKTYDISNTVKEVIAAYEEKIEDKGIKLKLNIQKVLGEEIDKRYLKIVINNLMSNALKYTDKGGIAVSLTRDKVPDILDIRGYKEDGIKLQIKDTGIGIPEDQLKDIRYKTIRARNVGDREGTGIGIELIDNALSILGGRMYVESKEDEGSTFTVYLPAASSPAEKKGEMADADKVPQPTPRPTPSPAGGEGMLGEVIDTVAVSVGGNKELVKSIIGRHIDISVFERILMNQVTGLIGEWKSEVIPIVEEGLRKHGSPFDPVELKTFLKKEIKESHGSQDDDCVGTGCVAVLKVDFMLGDVNRILEESIQWEKLIKDLSRKAKIPLGTIRQKLLKDAKITKFMNNQSRSEGPPASSPVGGEVEQVFEMIKVRKDIVSQYANKAELEGRITKILGAIHIIEERTGIQQFQISPSSKKAILKTYLKNKTRLVTPESIVQRPLVDKFINKKKAEEWIRAHPEGMREYAKFIIDNITYIDQDEFESRLDGAVEEFKRSIKEREYILVVDSRENIKSDRSPIWVYDLAIEKGAHPAKIIVNLAESDAFQKAEESNIKDVLIIDDFSFTGNNIRNLVNQQPIKNARIHIIVPFMVPRALENLERDILRSKRQGKIEEHYIYRNEKITTIGEIADNAISNTKSSLERNQVRQIMERLKAINGIAGSQALTYFQAKTADGFAIFTPSPEEDGVIREGPVVNDKGNVINRITFVPKFSPPYEIDYMKTLKQEYQNNINNNLLASSPTHSKKPKSPRPTSSPAGGLGDDVRKKIAEGALNFARQIKERNIELIIMDGQSAELVLNKLLKSAWEKLYGSQEEMPKIEIIQTRRLYLKYNIFKPNPKEAVEFRNILKEQLSTEALKYLSSGDAYAFVDDNVLFGQKLVIFHEIFKLAGFQPPIFGSIVSNNAIDGQFDYFKIDPVYFYGINDPFVAIAFSDLISRGHDYSQDDYSQGEKDLINKEIASIIHVVQTSSPAGKKNNTASPAKPSVFYPISEEVLKYVNESVLPEENERIDVDGVTEGLQIGFVSALQEDRVETVFYDLIANALAEPNDEKAEVRVSLTELNEDEIELKIHNEGEIAWDVLRRELRNITKITGHKVYRTKEGAYNLSREDESEIEVLVDDVPTEDLVFVFHLSRGKDISRDSGGLGNGLANARMALRQNGGNLYITSSAREGTTVRAVYPKVSTYNETTGSSPASDREVGGIDLNPEMLELNVRGEGPDIVGAGRDLPLQELETMTINGFSPVILQIVPVTNLPVLLGIAPPEDETSPASEKPVASSRLTPFLKEERDTLALKD